MARTTIHNITSLRMNVKVSEMNGKDYKVITLVSDSTDGGSDTITFFTDSLDLLTNIPQASINLE